MKRGEVYWANLSPRSGSEQTGRRPVVILSHNAFNQAEGWRSIIVVPFSTSATQAGRAPTVVLLPVGTAGLNVAGAAICHQITTLDRAKLVDKIGVLSPEVLGQIEKAVMAALDIRCR